ncbi:MAG: hypothetical protein LW850_17240 [Planctomycetaceae bacterium]|nr:hypothetical protein [Planctomycetaceae bacterium]
MNNRKVLSVDADLILRIDRDPVLSFTHCLSSLTKSARSGTSTASRFLVSLGFILKNAVGPSKRRWSSVSDSISPRRNPVKTAIL